MNFIRASFGSVDNSYGLLNCSCDRRELPSGLENMTDRPPGDLLPGEIWAPSVGFAPLQEWWCIWWTEPDYTARRSGMVRSEVALLALEEAGELSSINHILKMLSGQELVNKLSIDDLAGITQALLENPVETVVVAKDLTQWPAVLSTIWENLWPAARRSFSARVALSPPQVVSSSTEIQLLCVPETKKNQWHTPFLKQHLGSSVAALEGKKSVGRAARYLAGERNRTLSALLLNFPLQDGDIRKLGILSRVADLSDSLDRERSFGCAVSLIRSLINLSATDSDLARKAVGHLTDCVADAELEELLSIANLELEPNPFGFSFFSELKRGLGRVMVGAKSDEIVRVLERLEPEQAQQTWQRAVSSALEEGIHSLESDWIERAVFWLGHPTVSVLVSKLVPESVEVEVLSVLESGLVKGDDSIDLIQSRATEKNWSRVHAWCLLTTLQSEKLVLEKQLGLAVKPEPGLLYLLDRLSIDSVVSSAIEIGNEFLLEEAARLSASFPDGLAQIDISNAAARRFWSKHIEHGGEALPGALEKRNVLMDLIDLAIEGEESFGLLRGLSKHLSGPICLHPRREELWEQIDSIDADTLLPLVAKEFLERQDASTSIPEPERHLARHAAGMVVQPSAKPCASVVASIIEWTCFQDENKAVELIRQFSSRDWLNFGDKVGTTVARRRWRMMAKEISAISRTITSASEAADLCSDLLPKRSFTIADFLFPWLEKEDAPNSRLSNYAIRVADLGSQLAPHQVQQIWERAGGNIGRLPALTTPLSTWQEAAKLAERGALQGGLKSLVSELLDEYPSNADLLDLFSEL